MIAEGTDPATLTAEQQASIVHQVQLFIDQQKQSQKGFGLEKVGRQIGLSGATISEVLSGKYKADRRPILLQLDAWLEQEIKRLEAPTTTTFVLTSVAKEIMTIANLASQLRTIGLVYGPETSGVGKTIALKAIHAETPGSIYCTIEKVHANPTGLMKTIAIAIGISPSHSVRTLYDRIKGILKDTSRLLIIDQIHNLRLSKDDKPLYYLTDLYDNTNHAPQLWCGTADIVGYLNRQSRKADESLAQVRRRISPVRDLMQRTRPKSEGGRDEPLFSVEEVREMFAKNKVRVSADGIRFLWKLACIVDSGALGTAKNVVRIATIIATHQGKGLMTAADLWAALRDCVQISTFNDIKSHFADDGDGHVSKVG